MTSATKSEPFIIPVRPAPDRKPKTDALAKYDDASWHTEGDWAEDLDEEASFTHIGMFLAFMVLSGFASETVIEDFGDQIEHLRTRQMTPGQLLQEMDGKLTSEEFTDEGNAFAESYYRTKGDPSFYTDYRKIFAKDKTGFYAVPDTWESFFKLKPLLDQRLAEWEASGADSS